INSSGKNIGYRAAQHEQNEKREGNEEFCYERGPSKHVVRQHRHERAKHSENSQRHKHAGGKNGYSMAPSKAKKIPTYSPRFENRHREEDAGREIGYNSQQQCEDPDCRKISKKVPAQ